MGKEEKQKFILPIGYIALVLIILIMVWGMSLNDGVRLEEKKIPKSDYELCINACKIKTSILFEGAVDFQRCADNCILVKCNQDAV